MTKNEIKIILLRDLQFKKSFEAKYNLKCSYCHTDIQIGDDFYFMEEKSKVCKNCFYELIDYLEEEL